MRLYQINSVLNYGSTGRIVEQIGCCVQAAGGQCRVAHGSKFPRPSALDHFVMGGRADVLWHEAQSFLLDRMGLASRRATRRLIDDIAAFRPDIVHLHNLHNYYLNYPILARYLASTGVPVVWTLHDCWPFTGHCCYFDATGCTRWQAACGDCPCPHGEYPRLLLPDHSARNYRLKRAAFEPLSGQLTLVPVSDWLAAYLKDSFLRNAACQVIHNGIDLQAFRPCNPSALRARLGLGGKKVALGVALPWIPRKGLKDMLALSASLPADQWQVVLVGLSPGQLAELPKVVLGVERTADVDELAQYYSLADVYVTTSYEDNFPSTNLEALACGTPVVTYATGGCPEAVDAATGRVVPQGDVAALAEAVRALDKARMTAACRARAERLFDRETCFGTYLHLYESLLSRKA